MNKRNGEGSGSVWPIEQTPIVHWVHQDLSSIIPEYSSMDESRLPLIFGHKGVMDYFNNWVPIEETTWKREGQSWTLKLCIDNDIWLRLTPILPELKMPDDPPLAIISPFVCSGLGELIFELHHLHLASNILQQGLKNLGGSGLTITKKSALAVLKGLRNYLGYDLIKPPYDDSNIHIMLKELFRRLNTHLKHDVHAIAFENFSSNLALSYADTKVKWEHHRSNQSGAERGLHSELDGVAIFADGRSIFLRKVVESLQYPKDIPTISQDREHGQSDCLIQPHPYPQKIEISSDWMRLKYGPLTFTFRKRKRVGCMLLKVLFEHRETHPDDYLPVSALKKRVGLQTIESSPWKILFQGMSLDEYERPFYESVFQSEILPKENEWGVRLNPSTVFVCADY